MATPVGRCSAFAAARRAHSTAAHSGFSIRPSANFGGCSRPGSVCASGGASESAYLPPTWRIGPAAFHGRRELWPPLTSPSAERRWFEIWRIACSCTSSVRMRPSVKRLLFGSEDLTQQVTVGLRDPQQEITVELHGFGPPVDVTDRHTLACAAPCMVGIALDAKPGTTGMLHFRERNGSHQLLGRLGLSFSESVGANVACFAVTSAKNYCLPAPQLWTRYAHWAYLRRNSPPDVPMAVIDIHAMPIVFICPRPVVVVSAAEGEVVNVFPMNLMGPLGAGQFGFALNSSRAASAHIKRAGRLESVPCRSTRRPWFASWATITSDRKACGLTNCPSTCSLPPNSASPSLPSPSEFARWR